MLGMLVWSAFAVGLAGTWWTYAPARKLWPIYLVLIAYCLFGVVGACSSR